MQFQPSIFSTFKAFAQYILFLTITVYKSELLLFFRIFVPNNFSSWLSVLHQVDDSSGSDQAITFTAQRTLSNASTISPEGEEEEDKEEEEFLVGDPGMEEGPSFRLGSISKVHTYIF